MNRTEFGPIWAEMLRAWPAAKPIEGTATKYARHLASFTQAEVAAAVDALTLESEFLPSIAAIWQRCVDARARAPGWEDAWTEAELHASGTDQPWSHEAAQQAARTIGLYEIRASTNPGATRAQFRDAYLPIYPPAPPPRVRLKRARAAAARAPSAGASKAQPMTLTGRTVYVVYMAFLEPFQKHHCQPPAGARHAARGDYRGR